MTPREAMAPADPPQICGSQGPFPDPAARSELVGASSAEGAAGASRAYPRRAGLCMTQTIGPAVSSWMSLRHLA